MTTETLPQVRLKIERRSSHPWIFQKMVDKPAQRLPAGSVVDILDRGGQWVGRGRALQRARSVIARRTAARGAPSSNVTGDPGVRPESHIFVGSKAPWFEITDDLTQYEGYPPAG